jgi:hypothetical protein
MRNPLPLAVVAFSLLVAFAWAEVEDVPLAKLPAPVVAAVEKRFPKAKLEEATREVDGKRYEVTLKAGGRVYDVTVLESGTIERIHKEVTVAELPKPAKGALEKAYPKGALKSLIEVTRVVDGKDVDDGYRAILEVPGGRPIEVRIERDGTISKR